MKTKGVKLTKPFSADEGLLVEISMTRRYKIRFVLGLALLRLGLRVLGGRLLVELVELREPDEGPQ